MHDLSIVIPSYNESHTALGELETTLTSMGAEVIIVDDGSKFPYPNAIKHETNAGYGKAIMTGILHATRPLIMTLDGDGQHSVSSAKNLYTVWNMLEVDMLIGSRRLDYEKPIRMWGRKVLNFIASLFTWIYLQDLNSGMRIFKKKIATGYFPILCKHFSFTTSLTMSYMCDNYRCEWFPIKVNERKFGKSHVKVVKDGFITLYYIVRIGFALRTRRIREWMRSLRR